VITGAQPLSSITRNYNALASSGINVQQNQVTGIKQDGAQVLVSFSAPPKLNTPSQYDYVVLSPGMGPVPGSIPGETSDFSLSYWEGSKALDLKNVLDHIPNKGTFVISIPSGSYKGSLAPYGRAFAVADYLQSRNCKVIVVDGHADFVSQKNDFVAALQSFGSHLLQTPSKYSYYAGGTVEYYPAATLNSLDLKSKILHTNLPLNFGSPNDGDIPYHAANVIPPQKANLDFAPDLLGGKSFAPVNARTFASTVAGFSHVHVIGDAAFLPLPTSSPTSVPKSGHAAVDEAKIAAAAILRTIAGRSLETSLVVSAVQYNAIRSTSAHQGIYAHAGYQWDQVHDSWVASGDFLGDASNTKDQAANISQENYNQGLTWRNALLADAFGR
jgi:NADPH-dependent 2,4-dienoyl-CoA reductase/sulfur reductase-like enzyme